MDKEQYALVELALTKGRPLARSGSIDDSPMTLREALTLRWAQRRPERFHVMPWDCALVKAVRANEINDRPFKPAWLSV